MGKFAVCINLLQFFPVCTRLVSLFDNYSHIFLCFCRHTVVCVLFNLNITHVLDLDTVSSIPNMYTIITEHTVLS